MNKIPEPVQETLGKYRLKKLSLILGQGTCGFLFAAMVTFLLYMFIITEIYIPVNILRGSFAAINILMFIYVVWWLAVKTAPLRHIKQLSRQFENDSERYDGIVPSLVEFSTQDYPGVSKELIEYSLKRYETAKPLPNRLNPADVKKTKLFTGYFLCALCVIGIITIARFSALRETYFFLMRPGLWETLHPDWHISPGNKKIKSGESLKVRIISSPATNEPGYIYYQFNENSGNWIKKKLNNEEKNKYSFKFPSVKKDFTYYVSGYYAHSEKYTVQVVQPVYIKNLNIEIQNPSYTGLSPKKNKEGDGTIVALAGATISISLISNRNISGAELFIGDDTLAMEVTGRTTASSQFTLKPVQEYSIRIKAPDGEYSSLTSYPVVVLPDMEPEIELLEPATDITIARKAVCGLVYYARDDFGLRDVNLYFRGDREEKYHSILLKSFLDNSTGYKGQYRWNLSFIDVTGFISLEYFLTVSDNNIVNGPGKSRTEIYHINFFEVEHKKVIAYQEALNDALMDVLSKAIENQAAIEEVAVKHGETAPLPVNKIKPISNKNESLMRSSMNLSKIMQNLLEKMQNDPLTMYETQRDFQLGQENLDELIRNSMNQLKNTLNQSVNPGMKKKDFHNNMQKAKKESEKIVSELEKLASLSDDILERQKLSDVTSKRNEARRAQEDLACALDELKKSQNPEMIKKLRKKLNNLKKSIAEMLDQINKLRKELPEDFINDPSLKKAQSSSVGEDMASLEKMMQSGSMEDVVSAAEKMLQSLEEMMANMSSAIEASRKKTEFPDKLAKKMDETEGELDRLIHEEEEVKEKTSGIKESSREKLSRWQKDNINKLKDSLDNIAKQTEALYQNNIVRAKDPYLQQLNSYFTPPMNQVSRLKKNQPGNTEELLENLIDRADKTMKQVRNKILSDVSNQGKNIKPLEDFIKRLKSIHNAELGLRDIDTLPLIASSQAGIQGRTVELMKKFPSLAPANEKKNLLDISSMMKKIIEDANNKIMPQNRIGTTAEALRNMIARFERRLSDEKNRMKDRKEFLKNLGGITKGLSDERSNYKKISNETFKNFLTPREKKDIEDLTKKQALIRKSARDLRKSVIELSNKTQTVGPEISDNLSLSLGEMGASEKHLNGYKLQQAVGSEENAIYYLWRARAGMKKRREKMSRKPGPGGASQSQQMGGGGGYYQYYLPNQGYRSKKEGNYGSRTGFVRLPGPDEFKPPKAFREDILKILKEKKYPPSYGKLIEKYFRRLSQ